MSKQEWREEVEIFYSFLHQNGLKKTYQKDLILETFLDTSGHLSVDDVYALVKKRDRRIGIVTVFRTLRSIAESGLAREISLGDGLKRFEHSHRHPPHHHIVCTGCRKVIEYACPELEEVQNKVLGRYDVQLSCHSFQSFGLCDDCRAHRPAAEGSQLDSERLLERDAIKLALCVAGKSMEFFQNLSLRNQDPGGRAVCLQFARNEEARIANLKGKLQELINQEKQIEGAPLFLHYDEDHLDRLIPDLSEHVKRGELRLDARAAADIQNLLDRNIASLLSAYAGKFPETEGKHILLKFAEFKDAYGRAGE